VNGQHLRAFLWLRWRLLVNQLRRRGSVNAVLALLLVGLVALSAAALFVIFFLVGLFALAKSSPAVLLYVWDSVVVTFLFVWAMGLVIELQRSEALSLEKFLHLPVSLKGAFLINYLSSLLSPTLIIFLSSMLALTLGLTLSQGPALLLLLPLLAAFFLMITAVTYQFQGWLAALMANKRRRRTVIVVATMVFILLSQLPNLLTLLGVWGTQRLDEPAIHVQQELKQLHHALETGKITRPQFERRRHEITKEFQAKIGQSNGSSSRQVEETTRLINLVLPPGWLPLGAALCAEDNFLPTLLCMLGMASLGMLSLWRSYRTTVRLYTGAFSAGKRAKVAVPTPAKTATPAGLLLEKHLPFLSEQATAVTLSSFHSLTRAPEAKMVLLTPVILLLVFGSLFLSRGADWPENVRPFMAFAAIGIVLFSMVQIVGNQFGFDRSGFRVFVLSAAPRWEILLGKNLAAAPLALTLSVLAVVLLQVVCPLRLDHLLAVLPQMISMYLLFCLLANWLSIFAPMAIRSGTLKPSNVNAISIVLQLVFTMLLPLALAPVLLPLAVEFVLVEWTGLGGLPIDLLLSLLECALIVYLYRLGLSWQGRVLQTREKEILRVVTVKED
jgi:hypothetical protein